MIGSIVEIDLMSYEKGKGAICDYRGTSNQDLFRPRRPFPREQKPMALKNGGVNAPAAVVRIKQIIIEFFIYLLTVV